MIKTMWLTKWIDIERLIHSFKTVIACLLGILLTKLIGFPADQWIVITILVIMCAQIYVGSVFQRSYLRFLGTLIGCLIAIITFLTAGDSLPVIAITLCASAFVFSYVATANERLTYACTLGAVTTAIIMLSHEPTVTYAAERFLEISVGILIATITSQFILPIHAKTHLRRTQAKTLTELRDYYQACIISQDQTLTQHEEFDENIVKLLSRQRQLAKEARREPFGIGFNPEQCVQLLECEKEILRAIDFMHLALVNLYAIKTNTLQLPALQKFNESIIAIFNQLITAVAQNKNLSASLPTSELAELKASLSYNELTSSEQEKAYIISLCFIAEILIKNMHALAVLYGASLIAEPQRVEK